MNIFRFRVDNNVHILYRMYVTTLNKHEKWWNYGIVIFIKSLSMNFVEMEATWNRC